MGPGGAKRVLVLDCDDTLWGGEVATLGPTGIALTPPFVAFQRHLAGLRRQGVRLAVVTDNAPVDARAPFLRNRAMVLSLSSFVAFEAGRGPKADALRRIAARLRQPLAAFVFFDDSPTERALLARALPQVTVIDVPTDPRDWVVALDAERWFAGWGTEPEPARDPEAGRSALQRQYGAHEAFLDALELTGEVRGIEAGDVDAVAELAASALGDTGALGRRLADAATFATLVRLWDRFGDEGIVGVVIGRRDHDDARCLRIETLAVTDRGADRTAHWFLLARTFARARTAGFARVVAESKARWLEGLGVPTCAPGEPAHATAELAGVSVPETFVTDCGP